jgi:DNA replication initiation complex subunit (GINS family)
MEGKTIESVKQLLEAEEQSDQVLNLPPETYSRLAAYMQKLRQTSRTAGEDPASRLANKQVWLLKGMVQQLLQTRLEKAAKSASAKSLLSEEKYVYDSHSEFERRKEAFTEAIINGRPSFFTAVQKSEMEKMITVRFLRPLGEIVGFDLKKYGPFGIHDVAQIPAGNAEALIGNGDATQVHWRDAL